MVRTVLVLHGPNLDLRAEPTLAAIDRALAEVATSLKLELKTVQAGAEAALCDALAKHRTWFDGVLVNPSSLAPLAYSLADALELIGKPAFEVLLEPVPPHRGASALLGIVEASFVGPRAYLDALEAAAGASGSKQATDAPAPSKRAPTNRTEKTLGRRAEPEAAANASATKPKTLGKRNEPSALAAASSSKVITRAQLRGMISDRLAGKLTPDALTMWAREKWQSLQWGGAVEPGHRELLDESLMLLSASSKHTDATLIAFMTKLDS